ncbi:NERD domain-containing protein [Anaerobacillus alkaliphilus]|uniref:NERD domain-containing protein n=1 Tax=Anaerobacillus alkaliphilus TaxID=1548597 RepID=A0A4Q0VS85_9BACI|nr:nuclease-related domain-containing protein [Anaerobacillus alkaliphilus]RXI99858.1 NERD domain-containing protein [Anaerobacillus alkaliphilus]
MNMFSKPRHESTELIILRYLNKRMILSEKDLLHLASLEKGYAGELIFDSWLERKLPNKFLVLSDLLLECNNTTFQIDSLVISPDPVYMFEVKNFEGDYVIKADKWYVRNGIEIQDPVLQLKRSETLLRKLLQQNGFQCTIEAYVVFVNPEFYLYQAPTNLPIIYPSQINRMLDKIKTNTLTPRERDYKLDSQLNSLHIVDSPYKRLPLYSYEQLKKGITCEKCSSFQVLYVNKLVVCTVCNHKEMAAKAVLRSVEEFRVLFPEKRISIDNIFNWCQIIDSKRTITTFLSANLHKVNHSRYTYFL